MEKRLFIDAETFVVGLLLEQRSNSIDFEQVEKFYFYIKNQVLEGIRFTEYQAVFIDASYPAIVRLSQYRPPIFGLAKKQIYLKNAQEELLSLVSSNPQVKQTIHDFVTNS